MISTLKVGSVYSGKLGSVCSGQVGSITTEEVGSILSEFPPNANSITGAASFISANATNSINKFYVLDSLYTQYGGGADSMALVNAIGINSALTTTNNIEANQKLFNGIYQTFHCRIILIIRNRFQSRNNRQSRGKHG